MSVPGTVPQSEAIQHPSCSTLTFDIPEPTAVSGSRRGRKEGSERVGLRRERASSTPSSSRWGAVSPLKCSLVLVTFCLKRKKKINNSCTPQHSSMEKKVHLSNQGPQIMKSVCSSSSTSLTSLTRFFSPSVLRSIGKERKLTNKP